MLYKDKTDFSTNVIQNKTMRDISVAVDGEGQAEVHLCREDGVWRTYPALAVPAGEISILTIPPVNWKLVIVGGPATVEVL